MGGYFWYKSLLDGDEAEAYTEISSGLLSMEQEIKVPELEYRRISEIYSMVKLDRPEIFYAAEPGVSEQNEFRAYFRCAKVSF